MNSCQCLLTWRYGLFSSFLVHIITVWQYSIRAHGIMLITWTDPVSGVYMCANMVIFGINHWICVWKQTINVSELVHLHSQLFLLQIRRCYRCSMQWMSIFACDLHSDSVDLCMKLPRRTTQTNSNEIVSGWEMCKHEISHRQFGQSYSTNSIANWSI